MPKANHPTFPTEQGRQAEMLRVQAESNRIQQDMINFQKQGGASVLELKRQTYTYQFADYIGNAEAVERVKRQLKLFQAGQTNGILQAYFNQRKDKSALQTKGILFHGPAGTGKSYLAKTLASEAGVPFFEMSGASFVKLFVGNGAKRVEEAFASIHRQAPNGAVFFVDEVDAVARIRSGESNQSEGDNTLNQLLIQLEKAAEKHNIMFVGATNRLDLLDPAFRSRIGQK